VADLPAASQGWNDSAPETRALGGPFKPFFGLSGYRRFPHALSLGELVTF